MKQWRSRNQDLIYMLQLTADAGEFLASPLNNFLCLLFSWNVERKISCVGLRLVQKKKKIGKREPNIHRRIQRKLNLNIQLYDSVLVVELCFSFLLLVSSVSSRWEKVGVMEAAAVMCW